MSRIPGDPGLGRQVLFALGGRLPERNRDWVRHELTDAGWRGRLTVRHLVVMLPLCAVLALLPGALWIRIAVPGLFLLCSVGIVALYADDIRVSRLRRPKYQRGRQRSPYRLRPVSTPASSSPRASDPHGSRPSPETLARG